ncbi:hypothetical protein D3C76_1351920 [compost metagenome]
MADHTDYRRKNGPVRFYHGSGLQLQRLVQHTFSVAGQPEINSHRLPFLQFYCFKLHQLRNMVILTLLHQQQRFVPCGKRIVTKR